MNCSTIILWGQLMQSESDLVGTKIESTKWKWYTSVILHKHELLKMNALWLHDNFIDKTLHMSIVYMNLFIHQYFEQCVQFQILSFAFF